MYGGVGGAMGINMPNMYGLPNQLGSNQNFQFGSNDFPALGSGADSNAGGVDYVRMASDPMNQKEFSMMNEDFPALPGAAPSTSSRRDDSDPQTQAQQQLQQQQAYQQEKQRQAMFLRSQQHEHDAQARQLQQMYQQQQQSQQPQPQQSSQPQQPQQSSSSQGLGVGGLRGLDKPGVGGAATGVGNLNFLDSGDKGLADIGLMASDLPSVAETSSQNAARREGLEEKFGLSGLLDVIRMTNKDLSLLVLGQDLTTCGLNLNSTESLHASFTSPFEENQAPASPSFVAPGCYMLSSAPIQADQMSRFQIETLFYMFYSMPKDVMQGMAAVELYRREWRYHSELRSWLKVSTQSEGAASGTPASFTYFDVNVMEIKPLVVQMRSNATAGLLSEEEIRMGQYRNPASTQPTQTQTPQPHSSQQQQQQQQQPQQQSAQQQQQLLSQQTQQMQQQALQSSQQPQA
jgi:CCR4-NOT transcription complex subunit 2